MPRKPTKKPVRKRPAATIKSEKTPVSSFLYIFVIAAVVGFAGFLYYLETNSVDNKVKATKTTKPTKEVHKAQTKQLAKPKETPIKYDFYGVLPNIEIEVDKPYPKPSKTLINSKNEPLKIVDKSSGPLYQLQISATSSEQKAEALRAELGFMGVQSNISPVKVSKGMLYRVRVGPSKDKVNLLRFKKILEKKGFKPILQTL
ncbi:MAG: SPOR domain-containing protein [Gammaproteobacteria bacterium]|nr:SPOR domain-containing protein [Gammaproteobacteria bacterium]